MGVTARSLSILARSALGLAAIIVLVAGCGGTVERADYAKPQLIDVGIHEFDGTGGVGFRLDVYKLRLAASGWWVQARIANDTPATWTVGRPHTRGGTKFGLFVASSKDDLRPAHLQATGHTTPTFLATRFDPPLPTVFGPHTTWRGRFGGEGRIPRESYVTFAFGRFSTLDEAPEGLPPSLLEVTAEPVHVP